MFCCTRFYVRDGALVGDLRDSLQPMIWRMELSRVHAVGFRVQQNGSSWDLGMEGSAGGFTTIASYPTQAAANKALAGIGAGLRRNGMLRRAVQSAFLVFVLAVFVYVAYSIGSSFFGSAVREESGIVELLPQAAAPVGKSLSADQILRAPPPAR